MGYLQDTCPLPKKSTKKKKGQIFNRKNCQIDYAPSLDGNEESEDEEQPELQKNEENMMKSESVDAQSLEKKNYSAETLSNDVNPADASFSGLKSAHETKSSDSDKDLVTVQ